MICPDCHNLLAVCSDPNGVDGRGFYPQRRICYVKAARDRASRVYDQLHEKDRPDDVGYLPTDGVAIWASPEDLTPDDRFLDEDFPGLDLPDDD